MCDSNGISSCDQRRLPLALINSDTSGSNTREEHFESRSTRNFVCYKSLVLPHIDDNNSRRVENSRRKRKASNLAKTCRMAQMLSTRNAATPMPSASNVSASCRKVESLTLVSSQHLSILKRMMDIEETDRFMSTDHRALREADPSFHEQVWRERVAQWCYDVLDYLEDSRDVAAVAMNIIDRYLAVLYEESSSSKRLVIGEFDYEVISFTALFLAIRVSGSNKELEISELLQLSSNSGMPEARHIVAAGNSMLEKLSWNNQILTANSFLRELVAILVTELDREEYSHLSCENVSSLVDFASYLVEVSVCDIYFMAVAHSRVAFGALALAMICNTDLFLNGTQSKGFLSHFFEIIEEHTSIMLECPLMNSILTRLLHVYNQSQEAVTDNVEKKIIQWGRSGKKDTYHTTLSHIIVDDDEEGSHLLDQKIFLVHESEQDADDHNNDHSVNTKNCRPVSPLPRGLC